MTKISEISPETLRLLEWEKVSRRVEDLCGSHAGKVLVRSLSFSVDPEEVSREYAEISQARRMITDESAIEITNLPVWDGELDVAKSGGVLSPPNLSSIFRALRTTERTRRHFQDRRGKYNLLASIAKQIPDLSDLVRFMDEKITEEGDVRETASPLLKKLKDRVEGARQRVQETAQALMDHPRLKKHLQDRFVTVRSGRSVLPFKPSVRGVSRGILHETSQTGQTIYFEPEELVHANNELAEARSEYEEEVRRILALLSSKIGERAEEIERAVAVSARIDLIQAKALFGDETKGVEPSVNGEGKLEIVSGRHPILVLSGKNTVPNNVKLGGEKRCLIVTGPNAGGKTVLLKMVGLFCLMAMAGIPVPAGPDTRIPLFSRILVAMGDMQEIERDLSTFSADILTLRDFFERADEDTLVLLDEVITGTDPREGGALGKAYLKNIVGRGACVVVTTHFEDVKYLPFEDGRFTVATMGFRESDLTPTYMMMEGIPGSSMGITVAEKLGFPREIVEAARRELGEVDARVETLMRELGRVKEEQELLREELAEERERLKRTREKLDAQLKRVREKRDAILEEARKKSLSIISKADETVKKTLEELKKERKFEVVRKASDVLKEMKKEVGKSETDIETRKKMSATRPARNAGEIRRGMKVYVPSVGKDGVVESVEKESILVSFGLVRSRVKVHDVRLYPNEEGREEKRKTGFLPGGSGALETGTRMHTLDVRGKLTEDALGELEIFLDRAMLGGIETVCIIHGHGTGALRKAVRDYLKNSPYTSDFRPGEKTEGGDGVTIVTLI